ncbi:unnamed protein product [Closterium sp. NIES-64]|nr:unnamed protein product [Closterium sp. NIES-64]
MLPMCPSMLPHVPFHDYPCALPCFPMCPSLLPHVPSLLPHVPYHASPCALPCFPMCPTMLPHVPFHASPCALPCFPMCPSMLPHVQNGPTGDRRTTTSDEAVDEAEMGNATVDVQWPDVELWSYDLHPVQGARPSSVASAFIVHAHAGDDGMGGSDPPMTNPASDNEGAVHDGDAAGSGYGQSLPRHWTQKAVSRCKAPAKEGPSKVSLPSFHFLDTATTRPPKSARPSRVAPLASHNITV